MAAAAVGARPSGTGGVPVRKGSRCGTISLEMMIVLPIFFTAIWGGAVLAYTSFAKAALQMTVMRAARELAATSAALRMTEHKVYRYGDFTETYGLKRSKVRMLVGLDGSIVVAGACYRMPLPLGTKSEPPRLELLDQLNQISQGYVDEWIDQIQEVYGDGARLVTDIQVLIAQFGGVINSLKEFKGSNGWKLIEFEPLKIANSEQSFNSPEGFDQLVYQRCRGSGLVGLVVQARSAFWSEPEDPKEPAQTDEKKPDPEEAPKRKLTLTLIERKVNLGNRVMATIETEPNTACSLIWRLPSGNLSEASDLVRNNPRKTDSGGRAYYSWNVPPNTTSGIGTVTARCGDLEASIPLEVPPRPPNG